MKKILKKTILITNIILLLTCQYLIFVKETTAISQSIHYVDHDPIYIDGNNDFIKQAKIENWIGTGTETDPYIIENYYIKAPSNIFAVDLISITNTNFHYIIRNCYLSGGDNGIYCSSTSSGIVHNNIIDGNSGNCINLKEVDSVEISNNEIGNIDGSLFAAIRLNFCTGAKIKTNTITDTSTSKAMYVVASNGGTIENNIVTSSDGGIVLSSCENIDVKKNEIKNGNGLGILLKESDRCTVSENIISNLVEIAIDIDGSSLSEESGMYNEISKNSITSCGYGISLHTADYNTVKDNELKKNTYGIVITANSHQNTISMNSITESESYGIYIGKYGFQTLAPYENTIKMNTFIINNIKMGELNQAYDEGEENEFSYNYWDEWDDEPDKDNDGIVDNPYYFDYNEDPFPRKRTETNFSSNFKATNDKSDPTHNKTNHTTKEEATFPTSPLAIISMVFIIISKRRKK